MVKKILLVAALVAPIFVSAQKIAVVNSKAIFEAMPEKVAAENQLNGLLAKYNEENSKLEREFNQKYSEYQALDSTTPKSIKARRVQEIQENQQKIADYQQMVDQDMKLKQAELLDPIKNKIQNVIDSIGSEDGYSLILDVSVTPVAFKGADTKDITSDVKTRLGLK